MNVQGTVTGRTSVIKPSIGQDFNTVMTAVIEMAKRDNATKFVQFNTDFITVKPTTHLKALQQAYSPFSEVTVRTNKPSLAPALDALLYTLPHIVDNPHRLVHWLQKAGRVTQYDFPHISTFNSLLTHVLGTHGYIADVHSGSEVTFITSDRSVFAEYLIGQALDAAINAVPFPEILNCFIDNYCEQYPTQEDFFQTGIDCRDCGAELAVDMRTMQTTCTQIRDSHYDVYTGCGSTLTKSWPNGFRTEATWPDTSSTDTHHTFAQAENVSKMLFANGMGGERKIFPEVVKIVAVLESKHGR